MIKENFIVNENCLLKINLNIIGENYLKIKKKISQNSEVSAVLKSNAYGLGLENVAKKLESLGCNSFFLNSISEAFFLRGISSASNIFLLNGLVNLHVNDVKKLFQKKIIPVINSIDELKDLLKLEKKINAHLNVCLHFDTGINRLGILESDLVDIKKICKNNRLQVKYIMSHLIASDEKTKLNLEQKNNFDKIIKYFPNTIRSISNSNAINNYNVLQYQMVRSGGNIFGVTSPDYTQTFSLYARVLQIKFVKKSLNYFGYNSTYQSKRSKKIAIIGVGYADGYPRCLSNISEVFFTKRLSVIGSISMDYSIIDISSLDSGVMKVGDWVELIGDNIKIKEISRKSQTIPYEILINICSRAKKQYIG